MLHVYYNYIYVMILIARGGDPPVHCNDVPPPFLATKTFHKKTPQILSKKSIKLLI